MLHFESLPDGAEVSLKPWAEGMGMTRTASRTSRPPASGGPNPPRGSRSPLRPG
jgi:hypothetical protein